jgi:hypothetical protein
MRAEQVGIQDGGMAQEAWDKMTNPYRMCVYLNAALLGSPRRTAVLRLMSTHGTNYDNKAAADKIREHFPTPPKPGEK